MFVAHFHNVLVRQADIWIDTTHRVIGHEVPFLRGLNRVVFGMLVHPFVELGGVLGGGTGVGSAGAWNAKVEAAGEDTRFCFFPIGACSREPFSFDRANWRFVFQGAVFGIVEKAIRQSAVDANSDTVCIRPHEPEPLAAAIAFLSLGHVSRAPKIQLCLAWRNCIAAPLPADATHRKRAAALRAG